MKQPKFPLSYQNLIDQHLDILKSLQYSTGLFAASSKSVETGYNKSWLRDNFYECLAFEVLNDWDTVEKTYDALVQIFLKYEKKIDYAISNKPQAKHEYIHARFDPDTFEEFWEEWGNKQNDSIGAILFKVGQLEKIRSKSIFETKDHVRIINKLVKYLASIEYWRDEDSGMWEEDEEIHASSVGACLAGLQSINQLPQIDVPYYLIKNGQDALDKLLPRESAKKFVDLSLLSLIFPYEIVSVEQRDEILKNIEYHLLRKNGVIRYKNDKYYNRNPDGISEEAEWTFGLSWLAIIYEKMNMPQKAEFFIHKMLQTQTQEGIPELFYSNTNKPNKNTPLGWSESLFIVALYQINKNIQS